MKKWNTPVVDELNISETAHRLFGNTRDGGYIGDGQISGHLEWSKPVDPDGDQDSPVESLS